MKPAFAAAQFSAAEPDNVRGSCTAGAAAAPDSDRQKNPNGLCFHISGKEVATDVERRRRTMREQLQACDNHFHRFVPSQLPITLCRTIEEP